MEFREPVSGLFARCPSCGAAREGGEGARYFRCAACGFQLYFNVAAAVGVFLRDAAGRLLFIRRARDPAAGKLGVPGGFVDPGESAEEALAREVFEEVGLRSGPLAYLGSFPNRYAYGGVRYHTTDLFFVAEALAPEGARPSGEVAELLWLEPDRVELGEIAFESMRRAFGLLRDARSAYRPPSPFARGR